MRERRLKLYFVSKEEVFRQCMRPFPDNMAVIQHKELPKGYEIIEVHYDYYEACINFVGEMQRPPRNTGAWAGD